MTGEPPLVSLDAVYRRYAGPPPVDALLPCTFEIGRGELVAITGPSGSGKSTLLNLLGLLDSPSGGRYLLDDMDVGLLGDGARSALRARAIGFVFQSFHLLPNRTSLENVALALTYNGTHHRLREEQAHGALARVSLEHRLNALPTTLSGGEQQRVAIARALVGRPPLVLCDEPTGNLDSANAETVLELLVELSADGYTVIIVTHDPSVAARARRRLTLRDGQVSEAP